MEIYIYGCGILGEERGRGEGNGFLRTWRGNDSIILVWHLEFGGRGK